MSHALLGLFYLAVLTLIPPAPVNRSLPSGQAASSLPGGKYLAAVETNLHAREGTPIMNIQSRVSFLTNNAEVGTIAATSGPGLDPAGSHAWEVSSDFIEDRVRVN